MTSQPKNPIQDQRKEFIKGFFSRAAGVYDRVGPRFFSQFGKRLVEIAHIQPGANVLDIASGRGAVLIPAAEAVGKDGHVTGIDLTAAMVEITQKDLERLALAQARILQMDAENLTFTDNSFDNLLCGFGVFFFPHPEQAFSEFRRVLKPGGTLAISTWDQSFEGEWRWLDQVFEVYQPPPPKEPQRAKAEPSPDFGDPESLRSFLTSWGFSDVKFLLETTDFIYQDENELWESLWSHGTRAGLERLEKSIEAERFERFKADLMETMRTRRQADGIHQNFPVLYTLAKRDEFA